MSLNCRPTRERNTVDYTGIGLAATPGWLKGNKGPPKSTFIQPLEIQYNDVQVPPPDKGTKRRQSPTDKAPARAEPVKSVKAVTTLSAAEAPTARAASKDVPISSRADRPAKTQKENIHLPGTILQPRADTKRRGQSAPEPPQLQQDAPAAAPAARRRAGNEATPKAVAVVLVPKAATVPLVSKKRKEAAVADTLNPAALAPAVVAATAAGPLVNKRRKTTGSSAPLPAAITAPNSGVRPVIATAAAAQKDKPAAAAITAVQQETAAAEGITAPAQRASRHRGATAGPANAVTLPAAKGVNATASGRVLAEVTPPAPAAKQNATQQATVVSKDTPPVQAGKQPQKVSTQKGAAGPSSQVNQQLTKDAPTRQAPAERNAVAPKSVAQIRTGSDQPQAPSQKQAPSAAMRACNDAPASGAATSVVATAATMAAAAAVLATQQPAIGVTGRAALVLSHADAPALATGTPAGVAVQVATTSAAGPSNVNAGALAARSEGRAFLTLQGQYKDLQEQYIALKAQKVVELEELVAGHDVHVEEMTGAAKRLADLWHKQTLAQMALVQAGTSQDVAARLQQLQGEVLALKEAGADSELRLLQQTHSNTQLQAQLQEVRSALATALQPKEAVMVPAVQAEVPVGHCSISMQFPSPGPTLPAGPNISPAPQQTTLSNSTPPLTGAAGTAPTAATPATTPAAAAVGGQQPVLNEIQTAPRLEAGTPAALRALLVATQLQSSAISGLAPPQLTLLPSSASSAANVSNPGWGQTSNQTGTPLTQQSLGLQRTLTEMQAAVANIFVNPSAFCAQQQSGDTPSAASTPSFGLNRVIADMQLAVSNAAAIVHAVVGTPESEIAARDLDSPVEGWRQGTPTTATGMPLLQQQLLSPGHNSAGGIASPNGIAGVVGGGFTTSATFVELNPQESARKAILNAAERQVQGSGSGMLPAAVLPPLFAGSGVSTAAPRIQGDAQVGQQSQLAAAAALPLPLSPAINAQRRLHLEEDAVIYTQSAALQSPVKLSATQLGQMGSAAPASPVTAGVATTTSANNPNQFPPATAPLPDTVPGPSIGAQPAVTGPLCTRTPPRKAATVTALATATTPAVQQLVQPKGSVGGAHAAGSPIISNQDSCSGPHEENQHGAMDPVAAAGTLTALDNNNVGSRTPTASQPRPVGAFPGSLPPGSAPRTAPRPPLPPGSARRTSTPGAMTPGTAAINAGLHKLLGWTCQPVPLKPHTFRWTHSVTAFTFEIGPTLMDEDPDELQEVFQAFDGDLQEGQSQGGAAAGQWLEYTLIACGTARLESFLQDSFQFPESSSAMLMGGLLTVDRA